jgi:hypothetical protein
LPLKVGAWTLTVKAPPPIMRACAAEYEGNTTDTRGLPLTVRAWPLTMRA